MIQNTNTIGALSINSQFTLRPVHIAGLGGMIFILGGLGYGIYALVKAFANNGEECTAPPSPPSKLITNCSALGDAALCRETYTELTIYCPFDRAFAGNATPTGLVKRSGINLDEFTKFVKNFLPSVLNLHCVNSDTINMKNLHCCSPYNFNTSICNGILSNNLSANPVVFPSMRNISVCSGVSCTSVVSVYSAAIDLDSMNASTNCVEHILWGNSVEAGEGYNWDITC